MVSAGVGVYTPQTGPRSEVTANVSFESDEADFLVLSVST